MMLTRVRVNISVVLQYTCKSVLVKYVMCMDELYILVGWPCFRILYVMRSIFNCSIPIYCVVILKVWKIE